MLYVNRELPHYILHSSKQEFLSTQPKGDIDEKYLQHIESLRNDSTREGGDGDNEVIELHNNP